MSASAASIARDDAALRRWRVEVSQAALAFESRWTFLALRRVDPALCDRLLEQRSLFDAACITGTAEDIELHGPAMCRGWLAATTLLEQRNEPDDAYQLGRCPRTGLTVAIGEQKAAAGRAKAEHGAIWVTPDEVATLFASAEGFKMVGAVKRLWPGAAVVDRYPHEPSSPLRDGDDYEGADRSEDAA